MNVHFHEPVLLHWTVQPIRLLPVIDFAQRIA